MKKCSLFIAALAMTIIYCTAALAWEDKGIIIDTDVEYSEMKVSKSGLDVRLRNTSTVDIRISLRALFRDRTGNSIGYSIIGLREIPAGTTVDIAGNHVTGNWKQCRDAPRMIWEKMTYELLYYYDPEPERVSPGGLSILDMTVTP
jgi:hypothetical protein